jgi:mono/diheme cytochrome c family protein
VSDVKEEDIRMKSLSGVIWIALALWFAPPSFAADAAAGKEIFAKRCASCHGAEGEGRASLAKMLKVELRHLGSKEVQALSDADLKKATVEGVGKMKGISGLDAKAADDVVAFMRTLKMK